MSPCPPRLLCSEAVRGATVLLLGGLTACGGGLELRHSTPPWPQGRTKVVLGLDATGAPTAEPSVFGPTEIVEATYGPEVERLLVLTFADPARDLARCGASIGGEYPALPAPDEVYAAPRLHEGGALDLEPAAAPGFDLRYATCAPRAGPACPAVSISELPLDAPEDSEVDALAVHQGRLYVSAVGVEAEHQLFVLEGDRFEPVVLPEHPDNPQLGLRALASSDDALWLAYGRRILELSGDLSEVRTSTTLAFDPQRLIAEGPGGPVLATKAVDGEGALADLTGALPDLDEPSGGAVLDGPEHRFALVPRGILRFDGSAWREDYTFDVTEGYGVLGGDRWATAAGNVVGGLLVREPFSGDWRPVPPAPGDEFKLRLVLSLGPGRLLVAGNDGFVGLYDEGRWCNPPRERVNVIDGGLVHEGVAYLGTSHVGAVRGDRPFVLRVEVLNP